MDTSVYLVSFNEVKAYVVSCYKHNRLYGRNSATGWHDQYGDDIINGYVKQIHEPNEQLWISRHESKNGLPHCFGVGSIVRHYTDAMSYFELQSMLNQCDTMLQWAFAQNYGRWFLVNLRRRRDVIQQALNRRN